jgi:DNA polymerase-3 subunit epsilon
MREIVLDTETTGFEPGEGHRLVEIGCVELFNRFPTGNSYHVYLNPERDMPQDAFKVHGLSAEFLRDKPVFSAIALEFSAFIGDSPLVIHNASFDTKFLNFELKRLSHLELHPGRIIDTLALARRKHPGASCTLDALCDRYHLDRSRRIKHGALLDAELLAEIYSELLGGKQAKLDLSALGGLRTNQAAAASTARRIELAPRLTEAERQAHATFVESLGETALWKLYLS